MGPISQRMSSRSSFFGCCHCLWNRVPSETRLALGRPLRHVYVPGMGVRVPGESLMCCFGDWFGFSAVVCAVAFYTVL